MHVDTMLRKEKDGTLYKTADQGSDGLALVPFQEETSKGVPAKFKKRKWEVPSKDEIPVCDRIDGRGEQYTQPAPGTLTSETSIGFNNSGV